MTGIREFTWQVDGEELSCALATPPYTVSAAERILIMHGAGNGSKQRNLPLARDFAEAGHQTLAFDFSGHGASSGALSELSLQRRLNQALGVLHRFAPDGAPLFLVGFSMSGQTVADLVARLRGRVTGLCLCAPGVYSPRAWELPFGKGFTAVLREQESWAESLAFDDYADFAGRAVLVLPERDDVIPPGVTSRIEQSLRRRAAFTKMVLEGADHKLGAWLSQRPEDRRRIVRAVTATDPELPVAVPVPEAG
ncbi:hypothetical protein GCM10018793_07660 [Streptomyces sulfonofaciens]|uniref:Serine aminopeptidase S33 domain-containing protein n=1 Tax=Streptomyces sulfonofaciens TaxID=68272 RepID=A0A919FSM6_9ACTN|nr:alpha/beta fold hydrolase [Streptomyces sulfonofaciens]GHH71750.1 hypothetical protein GCM10018793_07660 [Streptomyces sulfonofaciens]